MQAVGSDQRESPSGTILPGFTQQSPGPSWPPRSAAAGGSQPPAELLPGGCRSGAGGLPHPTSGGWVLKSCWFLPVFWPAHRLFSRQGSGGSCTLMVRSWDRQPPCYRREHPDRSLGQRRGGTRAHPSPAPLHGRSSGPGNSSARSGLCPQCCLESRHFWRKSSRFWLLRLLPCEATSCFEFPSVLPVLWHGVWLGSARASLPGVVKGEEHDENRQFCLPEPKATKAARVSAPVGGIRMKPSRTAAAAVQNTPRGRGKRRELGERRRQHQNGHGASHDRP